MTNDYKQYFASSRVHFGTLNHQGPYNSKMNKYLGKLIMYAHMTRETFF